MSDDLERDVADMLRHRVTGFPESYEPAPEAQARARRRRAIKFGAFATAVVVVVAGAVVAIAQSSDNTNPHHLTTAETTTVPATRSTVPTVACPVTYALTPDQPLPPPSTAPRTLPVAGGDALVSYAATTDDRYIVLAPQGWTCSAQVAADGQNGLAVRPRGQTGAEGAGIAVVNDYLWHGGVGSQVACAVSDDPAVKAYIDANYPELGPCPKAGRTLTRVDAHTTTFVDADGTRGAGWTVLPSSRTADDGKVSVLTCRPTSGLTSADCDVVIGDYVARLDASLSGPATTVPSVTAPPETVTTLPATGQVATVTCPVTYGVTPSQPLLAPSPAPRELAAGDASLVPSLASFASTTTAKFVVLGPRAWTCAATVGADGNDGMVVYPQPSSPNAAQPGLSDAPIAVDVDFLWHGGVGSATACSVFDDPAIVRYITQLYPELGPCPQAGRSVTHLDAHAATFVDADGARGAAWMQLPSSESAADGAINVVTCRPTQGLTAQMCDTIVADWIARVRSSPS